MINVEEKISVTSAPGVPQQRSGSMLDHAVQYADERHWDVLPGTWLEYTDGVTRCSCDLDVCDAPGAHATRPNWVGHATGSATSARRMWAKEPRASVLLPTGRTFDVLEVSEAAGCLALARMERMGTGLGPVAATPLGRMYFFVLPGGAAKVPDLVRQQGWSPELIDLVVRGEGTYVPAPPTRIGTRGSVHWVRRPTEANRWLPDVDELTPHLAYACGQERRNRL
ncbi:bifunctional DNA primase/polymerase [Streptomyces harbinensis]